MFRAKKMPSLKDLMHVEKKRRQTPEEIEAVMRSWLASRPKPSKG